MRFGLFVNDKKQRTKLLIILLLVFSFMATAATLAKNKGKETDSETVFYPIKAISTEEKIYTITATVTSEEEDENIEMLLSVCEGLGVNITFFTEADWIADNEELAAKMEKYGTLGLLIEKNLSGKSRNSIMEYVADCNDEFFEESGKYPKYVRSSQQIDDTFTQVLNAYGQYCISYESVLITGSTGTITQGSIIDIGFIDDKTAYLLAGSVSEAIAASLTCIEIESFLYEIGSETDEFGKQYT